MSSGSKRAVEMPTLALAVTIHGGWLALTWWHAALPVWAVIAAGGWLVAWHGSLQHETIHGHPTRWPWLNAMIGGAPLSLWLPYGVYRRSHLAHHRTPAITDPFDDPESRYLSSRERRALTLSRRLEATLLGRLLLGPFVTVGRFLAEEAVRAAREPGVAARDWLPHFASVVVVLLWLRFCGLGVGLYVLLCIYPGTMLTLLRSFAEHRADPTPGHRVAIVERAGPLALLYLNNNLHAAHPERRRCRGTLCPPSMPVIARRCSPAMAACFMGGTARWRSGSCCAPTTASCIRIIADDEGGVARHVRRAGDRRRQRRAVDAHRGAPDRLRHRRRTGEAGPAAAAPRDLE